jgi:hypothetical protein
VRDQDVHFVLTYLDLPVLLKFRYVHSWLAACVYAGAHYSVCLNAAMEISGPEYHERITIAEQDLNPHDVGVLVGADFGFEILQAFSIYLDLRYTLGIPSVLEFDGSRNSNLSLSLGYGFKL